MAKDTNKPTENKTVDKQTVKTATLKQTKSLVVKIQNEVTTQLASQEVMIALITTTFKDFTPVMVKTAITEGMMRGFLFQNFLNKDVYAIKYGNGYNLVTSIDYSRKIGMRSGIVGKTKPIYTTDENGVILTCEITVKKRFADGYVGDFTEEVFFSEYNTGKNQWATRPRTMIAKVAEMHALRQACPEELGKAYIEEEFQKNEVAGDVTIPELSEEDRVTFTEKLESAVNINELSTIWASLPPEAKVALETTKNELKAKLTTPTTNETGKI